MLEYEPEAPLGIDPLMGWTSSADMRRQVQLEFATCEEAVAYCRARADILYFKVFEAHRPVPKPKSYADNFRLTARNPGRIK